MLYTVINKENYGDEFENNKIVNDISYSSYSSSNLERIDENNYNNNNSNNNLNTNKYVMDNDVSHIDEYVIKNDKKYIEALFDKYIEQLQNK